MQAMPVQEEEMIELTGNAIKRFREYFNGKETGWVTGETMGTSVHYCGVDGILDYYRLLMQHLIENN
jgi:hypothetical protein